MANTKTSKPEDKLAIIISEVVLIVTAEMREKIERKRRKGRLLGEELTAKETGEVDLGEID